MMGPGFSWRDGEGKAVSPADSALRAPEPRRTTSSRERALILIASAPSVADAQAVLLVVAKGHTYKDGHAVTPSGRTLRILRRAVEARVDALRREALAS